jgi:[protein-PII] uridylyltransferase
VQPLADDYFRDLEGNRQVTPAAVNAAVRAYLDAARTHLLQRHDAGVLARTVNEEHADLTDRLVRKLFRLAEDAYFAGSPRLRSFRLAVVAVGGYGRRELALASDVDLLFLHRGKPNPYVETITESIIHRLWDARVAVAPATRTVADSLRVGREDLPTLTSYLDARFLIGDPGLFAELDREVRKELRADPLGFIERKLDERARRHARFGESPFLLQPNVREAVGGLRDYQTALWIARSVQWEVRRPEHLLLHGFVDPLELEELVRALDFLWRVRNELHRAGRKDDRLHFDAQGRLAERLGFAGTDHLLPIEQLMRSYYRHVKSIERVSERAIEHAQRLAAGRVRRRSTRRPVEEGFAVVDGRLEIPHESLLVERPVRILSAFAVAQSEDVPLSSRALRLVRAHLHRIDDALRKDPEAAAVLRRILGGERRVYRTLVAMNEIGVLGAYLPEFGLLDGLWQHDLYHTYTVDAHSLFLVEQLRRLRRGLFRDALPFPTELMQEVRDPVVLFLGCILHDIGKGRGGSHSARGARLVPEIAQRLGLDAEEEEAVAFLVLHHLTLSALAERRDVHDARVILNVANLVRTRARLRNLYLLTVADIRSVSREAWTRWKGGLLEELYRNAAEWLEAGVGDESAPEFFLGRALERAHAVESGVVARLAAEGVPEERTRALLDSMPRRYLISHDADEISGHLRCALDFLASGRPGGIYPFRREEGARSWGIVVFAPDRPGLLATMTGVLAASGHDILAAQIYTTREALAVQIYELVPIAGGPAEEEAERDRLERRFNAVLEGKQTVAALLAGRRRPLPAVARVHPPLVRITNDDSDFYTIIDVEGTDRPGFLHDVTRTLAAQDLDIAMSRVSTRATRVSDAFYVTENGHKILAAERHAELERALLDAIEPRSQ